MHRSAARCRACRFSFLDAFTSLVGISIPAQASRPRPRLPQPRIQPCQRFSAFSLLRQSSLRSTDEPPPQSSIPWYLQIEEPTPPAPISPILALQEIPPLPPNSPAILSSVLEHLSTQIGLDNLVLLDLRHLDPPPALGANLLMIIGTARSVKHLNVSADRFCRWVRKAYKLRPYADGLLGRNELKLKLRRKARKLALAQSVGNTVATRNVDDGITTGWICVNMGPVNEAALPEAQREAKISREEERQAISDEDRAEDEEEYENPDDDYVGFGSRTNSPRIVVQMFTEDKRLEMDLEGLWDVRNTRRAKRDKKANVEATEAVERKKLREQQDVVDAEDEAEASIENRSEAPNRFDEARPLGSN
ncbi:uncharacterized protein Z518_05262 [Rhinocladiella mackenziei CBS 650.93]|uniref:ATPase synthesis protein 25 n=1 Tax=Rhinocladiella mackenziei CBS 650.93 TaxID=1442369 RepID=A0A0D2IF03_9EURO|nr:uncharacterized protein Z518_05262 [Rhinocladiella mackenziei CBS 650.93]KIX04394.1 hypothetical protein Z518_05262 [Rhinocladiella mackenziei CBS 650.93]